MRAYKYRLYPNKTQTMLINKTLGCTRFVYNYFLDARIKAYQEKEETLNYTKCSAQMTELKQELNWLKEVDSIALQQSLRNLDTAYQNFFKHKSGFPKFKSKHNNRQSYRTQNQKNNIRVEGNRIKLPKIGKVKFANSRNFEGRIINATVSRTPSGKYFVSLLVDELPEKLSETDAVIGIDLGIKDFAVYSDGTVIPALNSYRKLEKKLVRAQRELSRKQKGSSNRNKARIKVARIHEKIANVRQDFLHKTSSKLINENQVIVLEDLNVEGMVKNHNLAKSISDASWSKFREYLQYKADWYGRTLVVIDTFFPSSQICSNCGFRNEEVKDLKVREWTCSNCESVHDRDLNASKNILSQGLKLLES